MEEFERLIRDLGEIESEIALLTLKKNELRASVQSLVETGGGKISVKGVATAMMTKPTVRVSYDTKTLDSIVAKATASGNPLAPELAGARSESVSSSYLLIKKD